MGEKARLGADSRRYSGVTRSAFEAMRQRLAQLDAHLPATDAGSLSSHGFSGSYAFDEASQSLEITISKYPLLAPKVMVWRALDEAVAKAID